MDVSQMREWIKTAYPYGKQWEQKVDRMSDGQIIAVYHRMVAKGQIKGA